MIWQSNPSATFGYGLPVDLAGAFPPLNNSGLPVLGDADPEPGPYLCQLAQEEGARPWPEWGAIVDEKIDGIRAIWLGSGAPMTREGKEIECAWWMCGPLHVLAERLGPGEWMIDAELTVGPNIESTLAAFRRKGHATDAVLHVFDAIPIDEYESGAPGDPLHERKRRLREAFDMGPIDGLQLVRSWECAMPEYVEPIAGKVWLAGGEGVVVKDRRAPYVRSRSKVWWKLKRAQTYSVQITGWAPMRHKPGHEPPDGEPRVGALLGLFEGRKVRISAGLSDADRLKWARLGDALPGRVAEVEAMERTLSGSLRHARFLRWRQRGEG